MIDLDNEPQTVEAVLTCPFCGGRPEIDVQQESNSIFCQCVECKAKGPVVDVMGFSIAGDPREWIGRATVEAVEMWNAVVEREPFIPPNE